MFSSKSLITSVVLVIAFVAVCYLDALVTQEYQCITTVINHMNAEVRRDCHDLETVLRKESKRSDHLRAYYHDYDMDRKMITRLEQNRSLSQTTKGRNVMNVYGITMADLERPRHIRSLLINRKLTDRVELLLDKVQSTNGLLGQPVDAQILLAEQGQEYLVDEEYELVFEMVSRMAEYKTSVLYDVGTGLQEAEKLPLVFDETPDYLSVKLRRYNQFTGERRTFINTVFPKP